MYPFTEGSFAPRNAWYVAGFPHEITHALLTRHILNEMVVFYRTEGGTPVALAGHCPHRNFPLGSGTLIGDNVQCGYHGITFASDGRCVRIPSQQNIPNNFRVRTYPLVEKGLWCWIWPGDPALADEALIPSNDEIGLTPGFVTRPMFSLTLDARYWLMNENLLDLSHVAFLHQSTLGTEENATTPEVRDSTERRLRSQRFMKGADATDLLKHRTEYRGLVDRTLGLEFYAPGFHYHRDQTSIHDQHPDRAGELLHESRHWHAVTPSTRHKSLYFLASAQRTEQQLDFISGYFKQIIDEDIFATEEIEKAASSAGRPKELTIAGDATAILGRRVLQAMMDREAQNQVAANAVA